MVIVEEAANVQPIRKYHIDTEMMQRNMIKLCMLKQNLKHSVSNVAFLRERYSV